MITSEIRGPLSPGERRHDVLVVGGGITGLACAHALVQAGVSPLVVESRARVGGCIESVEHEEGFLFESGPHTVRGVDQELVEDLRALELGDRILDLGRSGAGRYIVRKGRVVALPWSPVTFLTSDFLSLRGKLRLLREPWVGPSLRARPTLGDFVAHRLGPEVRDGPLDAFVGGIWAGDPHRISARAAFPGLIEGVAEHGSLFRYALARRAAAKTKGSDSAGNESAESTPKVFGLQGGLAAWPAALADRLGERVRTGVTVRALDRSGDGHWLATLRGRDGEIRVRSRHVVLTGGSRATLRVAAARLSADAVRALEEIRVAPLAVVHLGYAVEAVEEPPEGFGVLVPRREGRSCLGILFASALLPERAPVGALSTTTFFGGVRDPAKLERSDDELVELAHREHVELLGFRAPPRVAHVRRWHEAIPQYGVDHHRLVEVLEAEEAEAYGLHLAGRFRGGVSVPDCWRRGRDLGRRLAEELGTCRGSVSTAPASEMETEALAPSIGSRP